ncbi:MAG TPA: hypothetical protein VN969_44890 [Streptosporangiaceae bacterium]|nr:hypothetical protein [Streptosporangiaceae bacterium]
MSEPACWEVLRARVREVPDLYQPRASACCRVCRGPAGPGFGRCYQCAQHVQLGQGLLANAVVPVSYAVRGTPFAETLWRYKAEGASPEALLALLLVFLHDHATCIWRQAGMSGPDRVAVVPSGCGRPGAHPLLRLISPYLRLPLARLDMRPGEQGRDLNADRFQAAVPVGARVLLLDDSWVSGASAQSAAVALKRAGAAKVAVVVLGRHLNPAEPRASALAARPYDVAACAIHLPGVNHENG